MDISQIRTLLHVAELGSVSRAADRLGIAQPALSRQIRMLEAELGVPLFIRHGRGMVLTELGEQVLLPAAAMLERMDDIRRLAQTTQTSLQGRVRFGMTPTVAEIMTLPLIGRIRAAHPRLSLSFSTAFSGHLLDWLKRDELDCCVSYGGNVSGAVRSLPILLETLMLVGNRGSALDPGVPVDFRELATMDVILPGPSHGLRQIVDQCALQAGVRVRPIVEVDSLNAMIDLVNEGFGFSILPLAPLNGRLRGGDLVAAPLMNPTPNRQVVLTYPADRPVSASVRFVGEAFIEVAMQLVEQGAWAGHAIR